MQAYQPSEAGPPPSPKQPDWRTERSVFAYRTPNGEKRWGWLLLLLWFLVLWPVFLFGVWKRTGWKTGTKWISSILVMGLLLVAPATIILSSIPGVNAAAACNAMKRDGTTIQAAADLYWSENGVYPDATGGDKAKPDAGDVVDLMKLKGANILNGLPSGGEAFTYNTSLNGSVHGALVPNDPACVFN